MPAAKRPRGATAIRSDQPRLPRKYLLVAGAATAAVALIAILTSNNDVDSNRETPLADLSRAEEIAIQDDAATPQPETPAPAAPQVTPPQPIWHIQTVTGGDNLSLIFKRAGYNNRDVYRFVNKAPTGESLGRLYPGQTISFKADDAGELIAVRHKRSALETVTYHRIGEEFSTDHDLRTPEVRRSWASGRIDSSLFLAGQAAGISDNMIMELANIFGGVIDFILDPRKGDTIHVLYEELFLDGEKYKDGEIVAATFTNQGEVFNAFRYQDSAGDQGYYNEDGVSMRKAFLMAPLDFMRISSNFNLKRKHPIYKTVRAHRGTDYAAPTGTPVFAAGDGRVSQAGYSKANGNYVFIQHGEQYVTKYLHLHKRRVKTGQRVSQSQVIGSVGSTGAATGPHLHYEFLMNGVHRNPRTIHKKLPKAKSLASTEMPRFKETIHSASTELASLQDSEQATTTPSTGA
jgi:murein DD-endopeptidase MepM/ murein hydrolase activator NlpD